MQQLNFPAPRRHVEYQALVIVNPRKRYITTRPEECSEILNSGRNGTANLNRSKLL